MDRPASQPDPVRCALRRAAAAQARAARAGAVAARLERRAATAAAELSAVLGTSATRQRESQARFRSVAALHRRHAERLLSSATGRGEFITAVADCLSQPSAAIALLGARRDVLVATASDATARAAQGLELTLGEGPVHDISVASPLRPAGQVRAAELTTRWPLYGPELAALGVRCVAAAPLRVTTACVGALVMFGPAPAFPADLMQRLQVLAGGLTEAVVDDAVTADLIGSLGLAPVLEEDDVHRSVHQAAGMVSVQARIGIDDAYAVLRARAFATGEDLDTLATRVVRLEVRFT